MRRSSQAGAHLESPWNCELSETDACGVIPPHPSGTGPAMTSLDACTVFSSEILVPSPKSSWEERSAAAVAGLGLQPVIVSRQPSRLHDQLCKQRSLSPSSSEDFAAMAEQAGLIVRPPAVLSTAPQHKAAPAHFSAPAGSGYHGSSCDSPGQPTDYPAMAPPPYAPSWDTYPDQEPSETSSTFDEGDSSRDFEDYAHCQPPPPGVRSIVALGPDAGAMLHLEESTASIAHLQSLHSSHNHSWLNRMVQRGPGKRPCCFAVSCLAACIVIIVVGMISFVPDIETDFGTFMKTDSPSSNMWDAFNAAKEGRDEEGRRLNVMMYGTRDLVVLYETPSGDVMSSESLDWIQEFEAKMQALPKWQELCMTAEADAIFLCKDGLSVVNYVRPTPIMAEGASAQDIVPSTLLLDGHGRYSLPPASTMHLLEISSYTDVFFPRNYEMSTNMAPEALRTVYRFKVPCCESNAPASVVAEFESWFSQAWDELCEEGGLLELLQSGTGDVRVYFSGVGLDTLQVMQALGNDLKFALGSMLFVLLYLIAHTGSFFLGPVSMVTVILAVPLAYVFFAVLSGTTTMSIASMLSVFLIVGLGSDVVFVYTDFWRDSKTHFDDTSRRLAWTYLHAGKATLVTSFTTALSFFANIASVLKPLREFGFFMGLCVMLAWVLVSLIYAPLCCVQEQPPCKWKGCCCFCSCRRKKRAGELQAVVDILATSIARLQGGWSRWGGPYVVLVYRLRFVLVLGCVAVVGVLLGATVQETEVDTALPTLFPADHNLNRGKEVGELFHPIGDVLPLQIDVGGESLEAEVCREFDFQKDDDCPLFWCEADLQLPESEGAECICTRAVNPSCSADPGWVTLQARIVGNGLDIGQLPEAMRSFWDNSSGGSALHHGYGGNDPVSVAEFPPILIQEWETGVSKMAELYEASSMVDSARLPYSLRCGWDDLCYCNLIPCRTQSDLGWSAQSTPLTLPEERRRLRLELAPASPPALTPARGPGPRWLQETPTNKMADVVVTVGLDLSDSAPVLGSQASSELWSFLDTFNPSKPWAQRDMLKLCVDKTADLLVEGEACWIIDFRRYVLARGQRFPVHEDEFDAVLLEFTGGVVIGEPPMAPLSPTEYFWFRDGKLKAASFLFKVDVDRESTPAHEALDYMKRWDAYIAGWNAQASVFVEGAFHVAWLWVKAEAAQELVSSTLLTLVILLLLAFLAMFLFTFDLLLSFLVVVVTLSVVIGVAFFMLVLLGWDLGPVEVIALIVFIGYTVTYSLHVAHKYGHSNESRTPRKEVQHFRLTGNSSIRYKRTVYAVRAMGGAALGSAITTAGCAAFLMLCQLSIFSKLGLVVVAISFMSIAAALGPLPAALFLIGPVYPGQCRRPRLLRVFTKLLCKLGVSSRSDGAATAVDAPPTAAPDCEAAPVVASGNGNDIACANAPAKLAVGEFMSVQAPTWPPGSEAPPGSEVYVEKLPPLPLRTHLEGGLTVPQTNAYPPVSLPSVHPSSSLPEPVAPEGCLAEPLPPESPPSTSMHEPPVSAYPVEEAATSAFTAGSVLEFSMSAHPATAQLELPTSTCPPGDFPTDGAHEHTADMAPAISKQPSAGLVKGVSFNMDVHEIDPAPPVPGPTSNE